MFGLPSERFANYKCHYAYSMDTVIDNSLFKLQFVGYYSRAARIETDTSSLKDLEEYIQGCPGFNPGNAPRREYQSGNNPDYTQRYWIRSPMFINVGDGCARQPPRVDLHPWVLEAGRRSRWYTVNPDRPSVLSLEHGRLRDIRKSSPAALYKGDVVLFTFTASFTVGRGWATQLVPVELVRVLSGGVSSSSVDYSIPVVDRAVRPSLVDGEAITCEYSCLCIGIPIASNR